VGIMSRKKVPLSVLDLINEELEDFSIPFKVAVVDFSRVSEGFREGALEEVVYL